MKNETTTLPRIQGYYVIAPDGSLVRIKGRYVDSVFIDCKMKLFGADHYVVTIDFHDGDTFTWTTKNQEDATQFRDLVIKAMTE